VFAGTLKKMAAKVAIVAALEREIKPLVKRWTALEREHAGRKFRCFEQGDAVIVCGGIGPDYARRAAEALIALYTPGLIVSAGFAGALDDSLKPGDSFIPRRVVNAQDGSIAETQTGAGTLVSFDSVAGVKEKVKLAEAYGAQAVDMEAAAVARAAHIHGVPFASVKAISDDRDFDMPNMDRFVREGQFSSLRFVAYSITKPWLWMRLLRLAQNSGRAARTLCKLLTQYNQDPEFLENVPAALHLMKRRKG
jgi:adenosylhomocysteine nucleosidase